MGDIIDLLEKLKAAALKAFRESVRNCYRNCNYDTGDKTIAHKEGCYLNGRILACRHLRVSDLELIEITQEEWQKYKNEPPSKGA